MSGNAKQADIEEIRKLIRSGYATSQIISMRKWPMELIKDVKSEELENDKRLDRERVAEENNQHMENKKELHHKRFLESLGLNPDEEAQRAKELADQHFAAEAEAKKKFEEEEAAKKAAQEAEEARILQEQKDAEAKAKEEAEANQQSQDTNVTAPTLGAEGNVQQ